MAKQSKGENQLMDKIINLAKTRGFVFPGSEIYGGLANSWDYGPLGTELKNNIRDWWWEKFVQRRADMVGLDPAIFMNPKVWESSGHVSSFNDAMIDCKKCKGRFRADHVIEDKLPDAHVDGKTPEELTEMIKTEGLSCPNCGTKDSFTEARKFNLLFETHIGTVEGKKDTIYMRGEVAQGMFVNFKNILNTTRKRLPFGIAAQGKAFRNEITPGNFTYRTLEFDLMEFEYFIHEKEWQKTFDYWLAEQKAWLLEMGVSKKNVRVREHTKEELSHYSKRTVDIEYNTPFGWKEMFGLAYRTDFDLKIHSKNSGEDLSYVDPDTNEKFFPHVIEPTFGLTRLMLLIMLEAYREEEAPTADGKKELRTVMKFHPRLAPYKVAVLPLSKKAELTKVAHQVFDELINHYVCEYDETQSIGRRYRRQDEIGTPYCVTVDFETIEDKAVTVRDRDTMKQERVPVNELVDYLKTKLNV